MHRSPCLFPQGLKVENSVKLECQHFLSSKIKSTVRAKLWWNPSVRAYVWLSSKTLSGSPLRMLYIMRSFSRSVACKRHTALSCYNKSITLRGKIQHGCVPVGKFEQPEKSLQYHLRKHHNWFQMWLKLNTTILSINTCKQS